MIIKSKPNPYEENCKRFRNPVEHQLPALQELDCRRSLSVIKHQTAALFSS